MKRVSLYFSRNMNSRGVRILENDIILGNYEKFFFKADSLLKAYAYNFTGLHQKHKRLGFDMLIDKKKILRV